VLRNSPCERWAIITVVRPSNCEDSRRTLLSKASTAFAFQSRPRNLMICRIALKTPVLARARAVYGDLGVANPREIRWEVAGRLWCGMPVGSSDRICR
jgi:hypothetical protein